MDLPGTTLGNLLFNLGPAAVAAGVAAKKQRGRSYKGYPRSKRRRTSSRFYGQYQTGKELNFKDTTTTAAPLTGWLIDSGALFIAQGTAESTRIGRQVFVHSIHGQGKVQLDEDATGKDGCVFRYALILDKQANGAAPAALDLFETDGVASHKNLANSKRFVTLKTGEMVFNRIGSAGSETIGWLDCGHVFRKPIPIEYTSTTGTLSEIKSNNIIFVYARTLLDGTQVMSIDIRWRVRYTS